MTVTTLDLTAPAEVREVLEMVADLMCRCDLAWCEAHDAVPATDADWDTTLEAVEDCLEAWNGNAA